MGKNEGKEVICYARRVFGKPGSHEMDNLLIESRGQLWRLFCAPTKERPTPRHTKRFIVELSSSLDKPLKAKGPADYE